MSLNIVNNRSSFATFRATLNTWVASLNTANTNITTNTSNIATNASNIATNTSNIATNSSNISTLQGQMGTAQGDILLKQNKNAVSTLLYNYKTNTGAYTLDDGDNNAFVFITNVGAVFFTLPLSASVPSFVVGCKVIIFNDNTSTNNITIKPTSGATLLTSTALPTTIVPGASAIVLCVGTDKYLRIQ